MGRLKDFIAYLEERRDTMSEVEARLCRLQERYETFFQEVTRVRESEIQQLTTHTLNDRSVLPEWYNQELDATQRQVERDLQAQLDKLQARRDELAARAEQLRQGSWQAEGRLHSKNEALDREEERLKERSEQLLARINDFNSRIRALGKGFGFFANFFKMHKLAAERRQLDEEQADVLARIESLRSRWQEADEEHHAKEKDTKKEWIEQQTESNAVAAKIESLQSTWHQLVLRTTIERVLDSQTRQLPAASDSDPQCPRCSTRNPAANHFCQICAQRLGEDRLDFDGSLEEIAEINSHFKRFSDGMRACQELIGLVRGITSGIEAFTKSVEDVLESERKYPLPKLQITVPDWSVKYGTNFDWLKDVLCTSKMSMHPQAFAEQASKLVTTVLTEEYIKTYFETMGEELSKQAESQW